MPERRSRVLLVSDFNVQGLVAQLENDEDAPTVDGVSAPFGQPLATLLDGSLACWQGPLDAALVWTRPQAVVPGFAAVLRLERVDEDLLLGEVDAFAAAVRRAASRASAVLVPSWTLAPSHRGHGLLDLKPGLGVARTLARLNLRLWEALDAEPNVFALDAARWMAAAGPDGASARLWHLAKVPFAPAVFAAAVRGVKAALRALRGQSRRLLVVDLDDTLWGGTVGECGWQALRVGGHDGKGEAFAAFQEALLALARRGVVLGIASKNDEAVALEALDRHPEMRLRRRDFAGWRINWGDKAENVAALAAELRLGLSSVAFIDDHPAERARVREALPEVLVPEWPADPLLYASALQSLDCFDTAAVTAEDEGRAALYAAERERGRGQAGAASFDEWLAGLGLTVSTEELTDANLPRTVQLLNKTNQLNMATRRLSEPELRAWAAAGNRVWAFRVRDRFGDSGLTGLASLAVEAGRATVVDFVLSCRVMGRRVEEAMVAWLVDRARQLGARELCATYVPTQRNRPCLDFWRRSGFATEDGTRFTWDLGAEYPLPPAVQLIAS